MPNLWAGPKTDCQHFISVLNALGFSAGTWNPTRFARGNYGVRKIAGIHTAIVGFDITEPIRQETDKGFKLTSLTFIYRIGTEALNDHTVTLDRIEYENETAVGVNAITLSSADLSKTTHANPRVTTINVTSPVFNNVLDSKYVVEVTIDTPALTVYDFYGIIVNFSRDDL